MQPVVLVVALSVTLSMQAPQPLSAPRPIDAGQSLWAEELTWMEIRDLVKSGTTQNGPYVAGGKHNFVLQTVLPAIAKAIPGSLIAPAEERRMAGLLSLHGVDMSDVNKVVEIGRKLADYRAGITAKAFAASKLRLRPVK